ncbi:hypothetical protein M9458_034383, partial [Cirrhinus mrigala]
WTADCGRCLVPGLILAISPLFAGNGRLQDQSPNNRRSPERCASQSVGVKRFAMATADNGQPER